MTSAEAIDNSGHHLEPRKEMCKPASAIPTGTELFSGVICSGHIDRSDERCGDKSPRCDQFDGEARTFSHHACKWLNRVSLTDPEADRPLSFLTRSNRPE